MSGTLIAAFKDFAEATGSAYVQDPKDLTNLADKHAYFWSRLFANNKKAIRGGEDINHNFVTADNGTYTKHLPGAFQNWSNPQRLLKATSRFRYALVHMTWVDQEILQNEKIRYGREEYVFEAFVDIRNEKELLMWTAKANGLENDLFAVPDTTKMEGAGAAAIEPMSFFTVCNEFTNGLFPSYAPGGAWTTVENVTPGAAEVNGKWSNVISRYTSAAQDNEGNIIGAMDDAFMDVRYEAPTMLKQYFTDPRMNKQMILTTKRGRKVYMTLLRGGQDRFIAGNQDPAYPDPQFHGIPVRRVDSLEAAAVYPGTGGTVLTTETNAAADGKGPRVYFWNGNFTYPVVHEERYFHKDEAGRDHNVRDTWVMPVATWWNLFTESPRYNAIVAPTGSVYT